MSTFVKLLLPEPKANIRDYSCGIAIETDRSGDRNMERFTFAVAYRDFAGRIIFQCCKTIQNNYNPAVRPWPSDIYIQQIQYQFPEITIMKETN